LILDEAMKVDAANCGKIRTFNPQTGALELQVQRGFSDGFVQSFRAVDPDDALASARAFRLRHRVTIPDLRNDPQAQRYLHAALEEGFRAMQATPIVDGGGRVVGTLSTHFPRVHAPSSASALVLDHCATKAAKLIERLIEPE
jgi:GAF domain-containing protein